MADALFEVPRLAAIYDVFDGDRGDLEVYAAMAAEFGARSVLDIGCGTGVFGCLLASRGFAVVGLDPAAASLEARLRDPRPGAPGLAVLGRRARAGRDSRCWCCRGRRRPVSRWTRSGTRPTAPALRWSSWRGGHKDVG